MWLLSGWSFEEKYVKIERAQIGGASVENKIVCEKYFSRIEKLENTSSIQCRKYM